MCTAGQGLVVSVLKMEMIVGDLDIDNYEATFRTRMIYSSRGKLRTCGDIGEELDNGRGRILDGDERPETVVRVDDDGTVGGIEALSVAHLAIDGKIFRTFQVHY